MGLLRTLAVALLPGAIALRRVPVPSENDTLSNNGLVAKAKSSKFFKQELGNLQDLQYFGNMSVGGQNLNAIFDTGSFELVVFSMSCPNCGMAPEYNEDDSTTLLLGNITQVHSYGSGSCRAKDAFDMVAVGSVVAENQPLWLAVFCDMPLLRQASFNAIAGLGPPGQPSFTAESTVSMLKEMEERFQALNESVPNELVEQMKTAKAELAVAKSKHEMLDTMGVSTFSTCLGRQPDSPGYLIWNDETRKGQPGVQEIPVSGNITWGVTVQNMSFHGHSRDGDVQLACEGGCGAIVDTGTSLIAVPSHMFQTIADSLRAMGDALDCSDLSHFPDLVMVAGGQTLRFPPSAYIGSYYGQASSEAAQFVRTETLGEGHSTPCQLLLMDLGPPQHTSLGPMVILGMPFFREYYTTFDLSGGRSQRSIFVSAPNDQCEPDVDGIVASDRSAHSYRYMPRRVNASALRVPNWYRWGRGAGTKRL